MSPRDSATVASVRSLMFGVVTPNMAQEEQNLTGGNTAKSVVRLGATVRKPVTTSTATVHSFLGHLRSVGFDGCPEALGVDSKGGRSWSSFQVRYGTAVHLIPKPTSVESALLFEHFMMLPPRSRLLHGLGGTIGPSRMVKRLSATATLRLGIWFVVPIVEHSSIGTMPYQQLAFGI